MVVCNEGRDLCLTDPRPPVARTIYKTEIRKQIDHVYEPIPAARTPGDVIAFSMALLAMLVAVIALLRANRNRCRGLKSS